MSRFVIVTFPDGVKAQSGALAIRDLHREANATIFGTAIVRREANGALGIVRRSDQGSIPLGVGALVEGLVDLFENPTGTPRSDYLRSELSDDTIADLARALPPGRFAVISEVSEDRVAPIDTRMQALGGKVVAVRKENFTADVIVDGMEALLADIDAWKADHAALKARAMERKLAKQIDDARAKLLRNADIARLRQGRVQEELDVGLTSLEEQAALATPDMRSRIEQRIGALRSDLGERAEKLARAYTLTQEALHG